MQIQQRLRNYPVPDFVWDEYHLSEEINDRGILVDMDVVTQAIRIDELSKSSLTEELQSRTGLDNPNSVMQMKEWLSDNGMAMESLGKKEVAAAIKGAPDDITEVLQLRQQLAKSSVKKYLAMQNAACADGRCHGMFQFYGANRSGRWCLTGDHEVLTQEGWIRLDEWAGGKIACWNATTEAVSFQEARQLAFDYNGPMYTYTDGRIDQCSTPDHKMRVQRRYGDPWSDMTVEEMSHVRPAIPMNGYRYHRGCANPAWLRVLIMTQADGHYTADGAVRFHFKKLRKIDRCKHLLRKAEIPFVVSESKDTVTITVPARAVPLWLREFRTKTFGYWLFDENPDVFFDELPNWDGYSPAPNSIQYSTCNKQNADIVQALAHMSGRCANIRLKKHSHKNENWKDAYEFMALGCENLQITTAIMQYGYRIIYDLEDGLRRYLARAGKKSVKEIVGGALANLVPADELDRETTQYPKFDKKACIRCGRCYISCFDGGHQAIEFDDQKGPTLVGSKCVGCQLCRLVCPAKAIGISERVRRK